MTRVNNFVENGGRLCRTLAWGFFEKKVSASAPPIWQSAGTRSDRRSLVCPAAVISGRWARRYDRCSVRGRPGAEEEAGAE